jgi:hypothetical protein
MPHCPFRGGQRRVLDRFVFPVPGSRALQSLPFAAIRPPFASFAPLVRAITGTMGLASAFRDS